MRRKIILILTLLLISDEVFGKNGNKTKQIKSVHKNYNSKNKLNSARVKRSLDDGIEKIFAKENIIDDSNQYDFFDGRGRDLKLKSAVEKESPFWGSRGKRESSSDETFPHVQLPIHNKHNKNSYKLLLNLEDNFNEEVPPYLSIRGRRDPDESKEDDTSQDLFWATRGRRQNEDPFWGTRGRRQEEEETPFWGSRGKRESSFNETVPDVQLPIHNKHNKNLYKLLLNLDDKFNEEVPSFFRIRGRRNPDESKEDDTSQDLFWATRGRRQNEDPFWGMRGRRQEEESPFWGNRGRRGNLLAPNWSNKEELNNDEPFWGNRGRREEEEEPFWGNRGRREQFEPYSGPGKNKAKSHYSYKNLLNQEKYPKDAIIDAIDDLRNNNFDKNRKVHILAPFWMNRGRSSKIRSLFNGLVRNRMQYNPNTSNKASANELLSKSFQQNTMHDDRIYAEEPHYILVERNSRSSTEDDPFVISRGKKYIKSNLAKAIRGRRGALEDIMKSVKNDPYNIARGKKDYLQIRKSNTAESQFIKTRDLICAFVDLLTMKQSKGNKVKREVLDNDRDRRTTLKKLALQLQMDPYFVSRGKKDGENNINMDDVEQLINKVIVLCN